jgi:predicted ATPase/transcriptional regulator with XRE-family HTH domain
VRSGISINVGAFGDSLREYLRDSGYTQKDLADAIGLHPKVLSRKLRGSSNAHLTQLDVKSIITTLARWNVITTRDEALHLLNQAQVGPTRFSTDEWQAPPLSQLTLDHIQPAPSSVTSTPTRAPQHNLPAPTTRLIGREWAVERLRHLLGREEVRMVTLVGSGGSGKTRLALHVASVMLGAFAQGVWFVALGGVSDPTLVPMSIIQALNMKPAPGSSPIQSLTTYLRDKQMLLVLDNFEQVRDAAAAVGELLAAAPGLKVLVTSRMVLHLYGERELSVPPLDLPDPSVMLETAELSQYEAIQLFVERAQAVVPDFILTAENGASIAQICARVDGLPLALELAAARVKMLPPSLLLERLSKARLSVLTGGARNLPGRQQTLRNTINWSYNLLSPDEHVWFPRLGVFTGGWSLEAAASMMQAVEADQEGTSVTDFMLEMHEQLVDDSLLVGLPMAGEQVRFTMLETLREYALERLTTQGELERLRDWHACYYLGVAEAAELGLRGAQQLVWLARLAADRDNFRAALEWSLQRARAGKMIGSRPRIEFSSTEEATETAGSGMDEPEAGPGARMLAVELCLRLAAALRHYWEWQGYLPEARSWLEAALELPLEEGAGETVLAARAKALSEVARVVCLQNELTRAVELADQSIALWQQLDNPSGLATALLHRGWGALTMDDYGLAKSVCEQGLQVLSPTGDMWLRGQLFLYLAAGAGFTADFERMRSFYAQSKELFEQIGDRSAVADLLKDLGGMSILEGKYTEAVACLLKSITLCYELDHKQYVASGMMSLAFAIGIRGEPEPRLASIQAAKVGGAAESLQNAIGFYSWMKNHPIVEAALQYIRSRVDEQDWEEALAAGRALTVEQAIELAYRLGGDTLS